MFTILLKCPKMSKDSLLAHRGQLAKPGSDRTGPDRTRSDRQNPDWFNIKIPANRHMKSLGHQLRLLPTFTGVLPEKVRTRVSIKS